MQPNHGQEKDKIIYTKKTLTTNIKSTTKTAQSRYTIHTCNNNMKAPTYKVTKHLIKLLNKHIILNNQYNVRHSTSLAADQIKLNLCKDHQMITDDMKDLYVNIPIEESVAITNQCS